MGKTVRKQVTQQEIDDVWAEAQRKAAQPEEEPTSGVPYWLQLPIWYLIRDTDCVYCIFLRGVLFGGTVVALIGGGIWAAWFR